MAEVLLQLQHYICTRKIKQTSKVNRMFAIEFINFIANLEVLKDISLVYDNPNNLGVNNNIVKAHFILVTCYKHCPLIFNARIDFN